MYQPETRPHERPRPTGLSQENGGTAGGGNDEIGGKCRRKMIAVMLDAIGRQRERQLGARDRAENLRERDVEIAQRGVRGFLLIVLLLRFLRQAILQVPRLMHERAVLRNEQQSRQHNLHQAALEEHRRTRLAPKRRTN